MPIYSVRFEAKKLNQLLKEPQRRRELLSPLPESLGDGNFGDSDDSTMFLFLFLGCFNELYGVLWATWVYI